MYMLLQHDICPSAIYNLYNRSRSTSRPVVTWPRLSRFCHFWSPDSSFFSQSLVQIWWIVSLFASAVFCGSYGHAAGSYLQGSVWWHDSTTYWRLPGLRDIHSTIKIVHVQHVSLVFDFTSLCCSSQWRDVNDSQVYTALSVNGIIYDGMAAHYLRWW